MRYGYGNDEVAAVRTAISLGAQCRLLFLGELILKYLARVAMEL